MATLSFHLTSYSATDPFTECSVNVVASNGVAFSSIPCEPATMAEIQAKKAALSQQMWDQSTIAAVCADKLGVPVIAGGPA